MTPPAAGARPLAALHAAFLAMAPRIERHGRIHMRGLKRGDDLEEAVAEMVALSWKWFLRLVARGKDPTRFPSAIAAYAARAVWRGRRVCGQEKGADVLSATAQRRHGFTVRSLPTHGSPLEHALADGAVSPVEEQVAFRMDFPRWLSLQSGRDRGIATDLMAGARMLDVACKYRLSRNRIFQMRVLFCEGWRLFQERRSGRHAPGLAKARPGGSPE